VPRAHRRRGIATALLGALHGFMRAHGKTVATMKAISPEGNAFMAAAGAEPRFQTVENRLAFDGLKWDELAQWQARATSAGGGLAWEVHAGRVPFERLAPLMRPFTELINQQPLGTLEMARIRYELEGYTRWYAEMDRRGGEHFLVMLRHGEDLAAVCDASWDARFPDRVYQQFTGVAGPWRSKGLAKGVKAAMLRLIRERHPTVRTMVTTNADANAPMLSINQRLGFVVHRREVSYQIGVDRLEAGLAGRGAVSQSLGGRGAPNS
jgi:GNAT superfamily N-acetyltransferase